MYLPQAVVSEYTLPSRVDSTRLHIPSGVDSARLYLPSRSGCSLEFDARSMISTPDPWSLSLKQNLGTVSVFASPAESSLADRGCQNHYRFPQQQVFSAVLSPVRISVFVIARTPCGGSFPHRILCAVHLQQPCQGPEDGDHFPSRSPCLSLAFYPAFRIPACRIILHCILPNRVAFPFSWSITPLKNSNIRM